MDESKILSNASVLIDGLIQDAMASLKKTGIGIVIILDHSDKVVGVVTDGDIRARLLVGGGLNDGVRTCMSENFVSVRKGASREIVLKALDSRLRIIPELDGEGKLVRLIRSGTDVSVLEGISRARAPARVSLAGGGTDFTHYYMDNGGAGLTFTVAKYSHALLKPRNDNVITIRSYDFQKSVQYDHLDELSYDGNLDLVKAGIKLMNPEFGFDLEVGSDFPPGSGLGGSAALLAAVIGCFNEFRDQRLNRYQVAELAFEAERIELRVSGGWQDQYSTVFGGFAFLEFNREHNVVMPLRLESEVQNELEDRFILCHTGESHLGQQIQTDNVVGGQVESVFDEHKEHLKNITDQMRSRLLRGDLDGIGEALGKTWELKKEVDPRVSSGKLDKIYATAIEAGATGGRLLGTGGGGFFLFYAPPFKKFGVILALRELKLHPESICFDQNGMLSWRF
jgi:D-glycero-alpha-D-manno-heptose-7-phosphate kinase